MSLVLSSRGMKPVCSLRAPTMASAGEHTAEERLFAHFEREDGDDLAVADGAVLGDVDGPGGLAHARAGGDDDELGVLEAGGHLVELNVVGGEAGDFLALLVEGVDGAEGAGDDFGDAGEAALDGGVGDVGETLFNVVEDGGGVFGLIGGGDHAVVEDAEELAEEALVLDDADVGLDVGVAGDALGEKGEVGGAADGVDLAALLKGVHDGDEVDGVAEGEEVDHDAVDTLVGVEGEVFGEELGGGVGDGDGVEEHGAEDRDLGLDGGGEGVGHGCGEAKRGHEGLSLWPGTAVGAVENRYGLVEWSTNGSERIVVQMKEAFVVRDPLRPVDHQVPGVGVEWVEKVVGGLG